jgi:hypothetical protein
MKKTMLAFHVSPKAYDQIVGEAKKAGVTISEFLRTIVLKYLNQEESNGETT